MKNYVQPGENITTTAAAAASSGDGVLIGALFGIAAGNAEIGDTLTIVTEGVFEMPKPATDVLAVGAEVFWDDAAGLATADDATGSNPKIGIAVSAAGNPSSSVRVRLNGTF